jgi:hypothetical protein
MGGTLRAERWAWKITDDASTRSSKVFHNAGDLRSAIRRGRNTCAERGAALRSAMTCHRYLLRCGRGEKDSGTKLPHEGITQETCGYPSGEVGRPAPSARSRFSFRNDQIVSAAPRASGAKTRSLRFRLL